MANVLIVHAHPEPKSFSSALAQTARETLARAGHTTAFSDLYAAGFDPVSSRSGFTTVANAGFFKPQAEERHAAHHDGFAPFLEAEIQKLETADVLIFSFPLWWFGMPAILKGWVDRVFAFGRIYGEGRWYERGIGRGKRAMVVMTTGSPASAYGRNGLHTPLESMLEPIHHGIFWFNGFTPLPPFVTWSAAHLTQAQREQELVRWERRLATITEEPGQSLAPAAEHQEGTWTDRIPRLLVTVSTRDDAVAGSPEDLAQLRELRRTGHLLHVSLTPSETRPWRAFLEFRAANADDVRALCQRLPLAAHSELEIVAIDPAAEDALSPCWPAT